MKKSLSEIVVNRIMILLKVMLVIIHNFYTGRQKAVTQTHFSYGETSYYTVIEKHY